MPSISTPSGTPVRAHTPLPMRRTPALTMLGILPGISIPPAISKGNQRLACSIEVQVVELEGHQRRIVERRRRDVRPEQRVPAEHRDVAPRQRGVGFADEHESGDEREDLDALDERLPRIFSDRDAHIDCAAIFAARNHAAQDAHRDESRQYVGDEQVEEPREGKVQGTGGERRERSAEGSQRAAEADREASDDDDMVALVLIALVLIALVLIALVLP